MFPSRFIAGDTLTFDVDALTIGGEIIASDAWTLTYRIRGNSVSLDQAATANGTGWTVTVAKATSQAYVAGKYGFSVEVAEIAGAMRRFTLGQGSVEILPNMATAAATFEGRSLAEQDLEAVEAAIRARLTGGAVAEYSIAGRALRYESMTALIMLRDDLKRQVFAAQQAAAIAAGLKTRKRVGIRFA